MTVSETSGSGVSRKRTVATAWLVFLVAILAVGAFAYYTQLSTGLIVTNMRNVVLWGLYMVTFIFFVGLSAGGLIICSSVCVFGAERYRPLARLGALLAAVCVVIAVMAVVADMGRPDRVLNLFTNSQFQSPLIWDLIVISTYLAISLITLWFMCRADFVRRGSRLALGSKDLSEGAIERDYKMVKGIAFIALPTAVLIHSVTAWIYGLQIARPWWNSALLAPVFLASAIVSGLSLLILTALIARRFRVMSFNMDIMPDLGKLLATVVAVDIFLKFTEILSRVWPSAKVELAPLLEVMMGSFSPVFALEWTLGGIIPFIILAYPKTRRNVTALALSSFLLIIGVFAYRVELLLPGFVGPHLAFPPGLSFGEYFSGIGSYVLRGQYFPSWIEFAVTAALMAFGALVVTIGAKIIPLEWSEQTSDQK